MSVEYERQKNVHRFGDAVRRCFERPKNAQKAHLEFGEIASRRADDEKREKESRCPTPEKKRGRKICVGGGETACPAVSLRGRRMETYAIYLALCPEKLYQFVVSRILSTVHGSAMTAFACSARRRKKEPCRKEVSRGTHVVLTYEVTMPARPMRVWMEKMLIASRERPT